MLSHENREFGIENGETKLLSNENGELKSNLYFSILHSQLFIRLVSAGEDDAHNLFDVGKTVAAFAEAIFLQSLHAIGPCCFFQFR